MKKTNGKTTRAKGDRFERQVVRILNDMGILAQRIPLSGSAGGSFDGDIVFPAFGKDRKMECKHRAAGFRQLYGWLAQNYALAVRADDSTPLICLRLADFALLVKNAELGRKA